MKREMVAITSIVFAGLFLGCAQTKNIDATSPTFSSQPTKEWSAEEHRQVADLLHEEAVRLEDQVAHLEQRVERIEKKPHLDPKGFKQQSWKRRMEAYRAENFLSFMNKSLGIMARPPDLMGCCHLRRKCSLPTFPPRRLSMSGLQKSTGKLPNCLTKMLFGWKPRWPTWSNGWSESTRSRIWIRKKLNDKSGGRL